MKIKEMIGALQLGKKEAEPTALRTAWGEQLVKSRAQKIPLCEYPRPQLRRENYTILNGTWEYAFRSSSKLSEQYDGEILVPFSPETAMSGVNRQLMPNEFLWYRRRIDLPEIPAQKRLILHFGACDERCRVYLNGAQVGFHAGGYQAFSFDVTPYCKTGENVLQICVRDRSDTSYHGRGKQMLQSGGMFYTAQSGLWQTVWYEWVPEVYLKRVHITPLYDEDSVQIELYSNEKKPGKACRIVICEQEVPVSELMVNPDSTQTESGGYAGRRTVMADGSIRAVLPIPNKKSWSPVSPFLYQVKILYGEDLVYSYFGMRHFSVETDVNGNPRLCLNHVPYFQNGVLDQGYWPESLLTPISEEAMIHDIMTAKQLGFNMIRKHCKIEPMRWYYHCDRLGMLVWQDMINGGEIYHMLRTSYIPTVFKGLRRTGDHHYAYMSRSNAKGRKEWKKECIETIEQLYNCTCICTWVLFNEGWGQFDAKENAKMVRAYDPTRIIDAHSGWFDQNAGDVKSEHIYFFDLVMEHSDKPYVISEYGGLSYEVSEHSYSQNVFGYGKYDTTKEFRRAYKAIQKKIQKLRGEGLSASVYTQLTDIEEEVNGLLTYDRKVNKLLES